MKKETSTYHWIWILIAILAVAAAGAAARAQAPDFSGEWKQDNDRCQPKRNGDVVLHIHYQPPNFTVDTTIARGSGGARHAEQAYTTDGKVSASTGADGDEFYTAVILKNSNLDFSIEEHEDGRVLHSTETWSLVENGATLQRIRERADGAKQVLIYRRQLTTQAAGNQP